MPFIALLIITPNDHLLCHLLTLATFTLLTTRWVLPFLSLDYHDIKVISSNLEEGETSLRHRHLSITITNQLSSVETRCPSSDSIKLEVNMSLRRRRKAIAYFFLVITILDIILISDYFQPCEGKKLKKKKILKKLKKFAPILLPIIKIKKLKLKMKLKKKKKKALILPAAMMMG